MKTDVNGCSTCPPGQEQAEIFWLKRLGKDIARVQYDYRHPDGRLFSCVAPNLEAARARRDEWLRRLGNASLS